jgi:uncharacterized DUF497 family protein
MRKIVISADGRFEWDEDKGRINMIDKKLHGVYSYEILSAFDDPYILELYDEAHSDFAETRFKCLVGYRILLSCIYHIRNEFGKPDRDNSCLTTCQ